MVKGARTISSISKMPRPVLGSPSGGSQRVVLSPGTGTPLISPFTVAGGEDKPAFRKGVTHRPAFVNELLSNALHGKGSPDDLIDKQDATSCFR